MLAPSVAAGAPEASPRQGGHHQVASWLGARISGAAGDLSHARGDVTERGYAGRGDVE
jgi:hypothetical protein